MRPEVIDTDDGNAELHFRIRPEFTIPGGAVQGGIVAVMLDMAMAIAGEGKMSTASLQLDIIRPVKGPSVTVRAEISRAGRRVIFAQADMHDTEGRLLARGRQPAVPLP